jgi:hypothetical protein
MFHSCTSTHTLKTVHMDNVEKYYSAECTIFYIRRLYFVS